MSFKPVIKWSGSKRSQADKILEFIPKNKYNVYYEPFCGGCSILYAILQSNIEFNRYECSDINKDLINLWNEIKNNPDKVINHYEELWNELNKDEDIDRKKRFYNSIRDRFNKERNPYDFMFINRICTNGLIRYNSKGNFNNSFHITRKGIKPESLKKIVLEWSKLLNDNNVIFTCRSYLDIKVEDNSLIYLDPPYANTKGMYYGGINLEDLWGFLRRQNNDFLLSFDGKSKTFDCTYNVPEDIYTEHKYIYAGNSSFRRIIGKSNDTYIEESLYIKKS